eukprot:COSAG05_NODE_174_length_14944_cov_32.054092_9_plen_86_part_00
MRSTAVAIVLFAAAVAAQGDAAQHISRPFATVLGFLHISVAWADRGTSIDSVCVWGGSDARPVLFTTEVAVDGKSLPIVVREVRV